MRKFQKHQILDVIQSLHMLHGEIKDSLNGKEYGIAQVALADCQEAVIQIGEVIEQMEGTGTQAVSCLEKYCDDCVIPIPYYDKNPDGSYKKVIFYNTSVNALLNDDEKMLAKMKDVFKVFKEDKDEIALLWRPHPLMQTTISSMRLQLRNEYQKIVDEYKEEGWGIYDDTADVNRAVILSDAYYGDRSSIVQLYQQTVKPLMIQNVNILSEE